jgi:L-lactate dehydrogenase complex protein LldF
MTPRKNQDDHATLAAAFNKDEPRVDWHDQTLWWVRRKRDAAVARVRDWETLRETASGIKDNVLSRLGEYLEQFEQAAISNGVKVHWAADASEHNAIVLSILRSHGIHQLVKSKSMLTEECHLNEFLGEQGVDVVDTDLGERVVQLAGEPPSHIVLPCIHKKKRRSASSFTNTWALLPGMPIQNS